MRWVRVSRGDPYAVALANRHYPRRRPGLTVGGPGEVVVLRTPESTALWVSARSRVERLDGYPHAWSNPHFRNESEHRASELILEALAATRAIFGDPPADGIVTYVDPAKVRPNRRPGRVYERVGFRLVGETDAAVAKRHGRPVLLRFHLAPELVPAPAPALELAATLFA